MQESKLDPAKLAEMLGIIAGLNIETLARAGAHEYDEDVAIPRMGSAGEQFLIAIRSSFITWVGQEKRFPQGEVDEADASGLWLSEATGDTVAYAYVDLGLHHSQHAAAARGAEVEDLRTVLDAVADQIVVTLTRDYGPIV